MDPSVHQVTLIFERGNARRKYRSDAVGRYACQPTTMRATALIFLLLPIVASACTAFKSTHEGVTIIGNNEDAWSTNAQVRFEQGGKGRYGGIYFGHYNGSPLKKMTDQVGMNEAGLVFDGLVIEPQGSRKAQRGRSLSFIDLMPMVLRSCSDVHQAADLLRTVDRSWLTGAMLFLADRNGEYLVVEADTMLLGNDPTFAVGNWRMSTCVDPGAIPIPRLQAGRALLNGDAPANVRFGTEVLDRMKACRSKLGEGTLFSTVFEPNKGVAHLYFYHDFTERIAFELEKELAKGDRTIPMASLFGVRPEYVALLSYRTPFHQRWIWWSIALIGVLSLLGVIWSVGLCLFHVIACIRSRSLVAFAPWGVIGLGCGIAVFLCGMLLLSEGVYYFGLGDATDRIHPLLRWAPLVLLACSIYLVVRSLRVTRHRAWIRSIAVLHGTLVAAMIYWGMLWPQ